jgi:hypothetical protein
VSVGDVVDLLLVGVLCLLLGVVELVVSLLVLDGLVVDLLLQVVDLLGLSVEILLLGGLLLLLLNLDLVLELLDLGLLLVLLRLLDEDVLRLGDLGVLHLVLLVRVLVDDVEHAKHSILAGGVEHGVVVGDSDSLDGQRVGLDFVDSFEGESDHLN